MLGIAITAGRTHDQNGRTHYHSPNQLEGSVLKQITQEQRQHERRDMLGTTTMARRTRDRNIQTRHSLNRLDGSVHNQPTTPHKKQRTKIHNTTTGNTIDAR
jgi:hypothetical protein